MSGTAQIFPVVGSGVTFPNPMPTQDAADGTPGSAVPSLALQVAGSDGTDLRVIATDVNGNVKVDLFGSSGVALDAVLGAAKPGNVLQVGGNDGTNAYALPLASGGSAVVVSSPANTNTATGDAPTLITTAISNGATQTNVNFRGAIITAILGTVSGTSPTLVMQLQWSPDGGTTWVNYGAATSAVTIITGNTVSVMVYPVTWSTFTSGAGDVQIAAPLPRTWRMTYTGGGIGFSIAIASVQVNYVL